MTYPPQGGYPQQPQQPYPAPGQPYAPQPAAYGNPYAPQQNYAPQSAFAPQGGGGHNFADLYGQADHSAGSVNYPKGLYDAVVDSNEFGQTKDGTKGRWELKFKITTCDYAGRGITMTLSVSPTKNDGSSNAQGMGIMFRQLGAMGVPVNPTGNPQQ